MLHAHGGGEAGVLKPEKGFHSKMTIFIQSAMLFLLNRINNKQFAAVSQTQKIRFVAVWHLENNELSDRLKEC